MKATTIRRQRKKEDAKKPFSFVITDDHSQNAECSNPGKCVIAQALMDSPVGQFLEGAEVGTNITKIYTATKVIRYKTPNKLRRQIPVFDQTGQWSLPSGEYTLLPFIKRPCRWPKAKKEGGVQDCFRGRTLPSRRVIRVEKLCSV